MSMREIGRRMVERGAFDEIEDFGFVRAAELPTCCSRAMLRHSCR